MSFLVAFEVVSNMSKDRGSRFMDPWRLRQTGPESKIFGNEEAEGGSLGGTSIDRNCVPTAT
jgi:hypothetical protein